MHAASRSARRTAGDPARAHACCNCTLDRPQPQPLRASRCPRVAALAAAASRACAPERDRSLSETWRRWRPRVPPPPPRIYYAGTSVPACLPELPPPLIPNIPSPRTPPEALPSSSHHVQTYAPSLAGRGRAIFSSMMPASTSHHRAAGFTCTIHESISSASTAATPKKNTQARPWTPRGSAFGRSRGRCSKRPLHVGPKPWPQALLQVRSRPL